MTFGNFIVCANHIGNRLDIPQRTIDKVRETKHIFCEHLMPFERNFVLPNNLNLDKKIVIETDFIQDDFKIADLAISILKQGDDVVFISDAGLPGFADRGTRIIDIIHKNKINVQIISGPSIVSSAVAVAGIPSSSTDVIFMSFFDYNPGQKINKIKQIQDMDSTIVILDFPEKINNLISILKETILDDRQIAVCVDIGMDSQRIIRGSISDIAKENLNFEYCYTTVVMEGSKKYCLDSYGDPDQT